MKRKNIIMITVGVLLTVVILMYSSYALFTTNQISKSAITIKAGTMNPTIKVDGTVANKLTVAAGETKTFNVTMENLNGATGKFLFYYTGTLATGLKFGYTTGTGIDTPPSTSGVVLAKNGKKTYTLKVKNGTTSSQTITLGSLGGLESPSLSIPSGGNIIPKFVEEQVLTTAIINKANDITVTSYESGNKTEAYTYQQTAGEQQSGWSTERLTDYRYVGNNPNNYIYFNCEDSTDLSTCELWRIIGVFYVKNGTKYELRAKIIKEEAIGDFAFDTKLAEEGICITSQPNTRFGNQDFSKSEVKAMLNNLYYSRKKGSCYSSETCDFTNTGILESARAYLAPAVWYLGSITTATTATASKVYQQERSETVWGYWDCNTEDLYHGNVVSTTTTFALAYPSDVMYARADGDKLNNWMLSKAGKLLSPYKTNVGTPPLETYSLIKSNGQVSSKYANFAENIFPTAYLKAEVMAVAGDGSINDPYQIALP